MRKPTARPVPSESLLARRAQPGDYTDCYTLDIARAVSLPQLISAFCNAPAFRPERWALHLIGKGAGAADVAALAAAETTQFAAWSVLEHTDTEILLQDFQQRTCSWLCVEELATTAPTIKGRTRLHFGSRVVRPNSLIFRALMPFHRWYAQALLKSAARRL